MTGFYMKYNTGLKWVNNRGFHRRGTLFVVKELRLLYHIIHITSYELTLPFKWVKKQSNFRCIQNAFNTVVLESMVLKVHCCHFHKKYLCENCLSYGQQPLRTTSKKFRCNREFLVFLKYRKGRYYSFQFCIKNLSNILIPGRLERSCI